MQSAKALMTTAREEASGLESRGAILFATMPALASEAQHRRFCQRPFCACVCIYDRALPGGLTATPVVELMLLAGFVDALRDLNVTLIATP